MFSVMLGQGCLRCSLEPIYFHVLVRWPCVTALLDGNAAFSFAHLFFVEQFFTNFAAFFKENTTAVSEFEQVVIVIRLFIYSIYYILLIYLSFCVCLLDMYQS